MMSTTEYRQERTKLLDHARGLLDKAKAEKRALSSDEVEKYDRMMEDADNLKFTIDRMEGRNIHGELPEILRNEQPAAQSDRRVLIPSLAEYRALTTTSDALGGYFTPPSQYPAWIDRLRTASVFLAAGPRDIPFNDAEGASKNVPLLSASATAGMYDENATLSASDETFGVATLVPKTGAVLVRASEQVMADSNPALRDVVAFDIQQELAALVDDQCLNGNGTAPNVRGLRNFADVTVTELGTGNGAAVGLDDIADAISRIELAGGQPSAIFCSVRTFNAIRKLKDGQNRYQLSPDPASDARRQLFGIPVYASGRIAVNERIGATSTCSWIAVADMRQIAFAMRQGVRLQYLVERYADQLQVGIIGSVRFDAACLNASAVEIISGVTN